MRRNQWDSGFHKAEGVAIKNVLNDTRQLTANVTVQPELRISDV